jgi:hypothetical protein
MKMIVAVLLTGLPALAEQEFQLDAGSGEADRRAFAHVPALRSQPPMSSIRASEGLMAPEQDKAGATLIDDNKNEQTSEWTLLDEGGPQIRVFQPKLRIYFDTGSDDPGEIDLFRDGSVAPSINFAEIYWPLKYPRWLGQPNWRWGPNLGFGISAPAADSSDGTNTASSAPVFMISAGFQLEFPLGGGGVDEAAGVEDAGTASSLVKETTLGLEVGYAHGFSADEGLTDADDGAVYVGLTLHVQF